MVTEKQLNEFRAVLTTALNHHLKNRQDPMNAMNGTSWHASEQASVEIYQELISEFDTIMDDR